VIYQRTKLVSRQEANTDSEQNVLVDTAFNAYLVQKAMNQIKKNVF
jgi:hypothetical protein